MIVLLFISGFVLRHYSWHHFYEPHIDEDSAGLLWYQYIYYPTYTRLDGLLAGVSVAAVYVFAPVLWVKISRYGNALLAISLLVLSVAYFVNSSPSYESCLFGFPLVALGYGIMVMAAISPSCFLHKWKSRTTTFIATVSYGVYLTHKGVIHMTQTVTEKLGLDRDGNWVLLLCILACLLFAGGFYLVVEKPFMRLRKILTNRRGQSNAEVVSL